jgi:hypothetical protein
MEPAPKPPSMLTKLLSTIHLPPSHPSSIAAHQPQFSSPKGSSPKVTKASLVDYNDI